MGRQENLGSGGRKGLTLSKILLAMAILAIVAAIIIPGDPGSHRIRRSPAVKAATEIRSIELGITKLLSDAGQSSLRDLFDARAFNETVARLSRTRSMDAFEASVEIYTYETYVLLRKGRHALEVPNDYGDTLNTEILGKLADSYLTELGLDPWGNPYQVFAGPWLDTMGPVLFRNYMIYASEQARLPGDIDIPNAEDQLLMEGLDYETGDPIEFSYPADARKDVYIWSFGENDISGQPIYDPTHRYDPPASLHYRGQFQEPELCGGGDDINNWDKGQSYMRFYN